MIIIGRNGSKPPLFRGHVPVIKPPAASGQPVVSTWKPSDLGTALVFAADTNDTGRTPADGAGLYHLYDATRVLSQATTAARPTPQAGGIGDTKRVLKFGTGKYLASTVGDAMSIVLNGTTSVTSSGVVAVAALLTAATFNAIVAWFNTTSLKYAQLRQSDTNVAAQVSDAATVWQAVNGAKLSATWHIITMVKSGASLTLRIDGVDIATSTIPATSGALDFNRFFIGARLTSGAIDATVPLDSLSGIVMANRTLTAAEKVGLDDWLKKTCGLIEAPVPVPTPLPEAGGGTVLPPTTLPITMTPSAPGARQTAGGAAIFSITVQTATMTQVEWRVEDAANFPRGPWVPLGSASQVGNALIGAGVAVQAPLVVSGDTVVVRKPGDSAVMVRSSPVTILDETTPTPALAKAHRDLLFKPNAVKWLVNNQFMELVNHNFDFAATIAHPDQGFMGYRSQLTWLRADGFEGYWQPASSPCYRVYRDGSNLNRVWFQAKNQAYAPEAGDDVVFYHQDNDGGYWDKAARTGITFNGLRINYGVKYKIAAGRQTASGNTEYAVDFAGGAPAINQNLRPDMGDAQWMWLRHWNFYIDRAQTKPRFPVDWLGATLRDQVIGNGGYAILGGEQGQPTWRDRTAEFREFGSIMAELQGQEVSWLANMFSGVDPRKLLIEPENEPTSGWLKDGTSGLGYKQALSEYHYPQFRKAFPDHSLGIKATSFGSLDSLRDEFDWVVPDGKNTIITAHNYDGQVRVGGGQLAFLSPEDAIYYADQMKKATVKAKAHGFGMTEFGIGHHYFWTIWDQSYVSIPDTEKAKGYGYFVTEFQRQGGFIAGWFRVGDHYNSTDFYTDIVPGKKIQAFYPQFRQFGAKAGLVTY